jgi:hypothetical protein
MPDLMTRIRDWLGVPHTPEGERELVRHVLENQEQRMSKVEQQRADKLGSYQRVRVR